METNTKTVKNILLRIKVAGYGIVNYDGQDQKWLFNVIGTHLKTSYNNTTYGKKNFYKNASDEVSYEIKTSADCLRHAIFEKEHPFQSPNIGHDEIVLYSFLGSPASILRGYLHEFGSGKATFKRKSPFELTDAVQIFDSRGLKAMSVIETFSKSGRKRTDNTIDDKADNTFFKKETVGDIEYLAQGFVDMDQLSFISTDIIFDRLGLNPDKFNLFSRFLKTRMPNFNSELGYYAMKNSAVLIPEYGFKFSNENIVDLVKHLFGLILNFNIRRKSASATISEFQYKLVYNPIEDTPYKNDGWVSVKSEEDIRKLNFEPETFYVKVDDQESKELRREIEESSKKQDKSSADRKQMVKDATAEAKSKKAKAKETITETV